MKGATLESKQFENELNNILKTTGLDVRNPNVLKDILRRGTILDYFGVDY